MPEPNGREGRVFACLFLSLAAVTFLVCAARYLPSPLRFDEADWPPQALGILRHGVPVVRYEEDRRLFTYAYYGYDAHYGMWHPPMYHYTLAAAVALFGRSDVAVRAVSVLWMAAAIGLAWLVVTRGERARDVRLRAVPLAVAALCPLVLHGAFFVDIDNTTLCAAVFLMAWLHMVLPADRPWRRRAWLGAAFGFALWSKLTTAPFMLIAIAIDVALRGRPKQALADLLGAGAIGASVFGAAYAGYCWALDYPAGFMFDITYVGKKQQYLTLQPFANMVRALRWNLVWISPPLLLAFAWGATRRAGRYLRDRRAEAGDVVLIFAALSLAAYCATGVVGKYTIPAAVGIAVVVGAEAARALRSVRSESPALVALLAGALALVHICVLPPLTVRPAGAETPASLRGMFADPRALQLTASIAAGVLVSVFVVRQLRGHRPGGGVLVALLLWLAAVNPVMEWRVALAPFDRSPLRPLEERGFRDVVAYLNERYTPDDRILCPKDIGYYYQGRHYVLDTSGAGETPLAKLPGAHARGVRAVVDSIAFPAVSDPRAIEQAGFRRSATIGDFAIYEAAGR